MKTNLLILGAILVIGATLLFIGFDREGPAPVGSYPVGIVRYSCNVANYFISSSSVLDNETGKNCSFTIVKTAKVGFNIDGTFYESLDEQKFKTIKLNEQCNFSKYDLLVLSDENSVYECFGIEGV